MFKVLATMATKTSCLAMARVDRKSDVQRRANDNDQHDDWQGFRHPGSLNRGSLCPKKMRLAVKWWQQS